MNILEFTKQFPTEISCKEHWVRIAISNAKRTLLGISHKIKGRYLQIYRNELCYKLNRRRYGERLFDRLNLAIDKSYC